MTRSHLWWPRAKLARVALIVYSLLACGAIGWYFIPGWLGSQEQFRAWSAEQQVECKLDRLVELKFVVEPSFDQWLAEWSRQSGLAVMCDTPNGADIGLQLHPLPAREALQTFCRTYEYDWIPEGEGIRLAAYPYATPLETRTYLVPLRRVDQREWIAAACRFAPSHFDWQKRKESPSSLHLTTSHHQHVFFENYFARLSAALDHTQSLGKLISPSDPAWQPLFLESDPAALATALRLLQKPITLDVKELPIREFAKQLATQLDYPVFIDPDLTQWIELDAPVVTCHVAEFPLGELRIPAQSHHLQLIPALSGHALLLVTDQYETTPERRLLFAWPVPDLIEPRPLLPDEQDPFEQLIGIVQTRGKMTREQSVLGNVLVVQDTLANQLRIQALLTAMREARSGMQGLVRRTQLQPKLPKNIAALDQPAELVYLNVPLAEVITDLQKRFGLTIEVEVFSRDVTNVWCHLPTQRLRDNLERLLAPYDLSLVVSGPRIQIVTQYEAVRHQDVEDFEFAVCNIRHFLAHHRQGGADEVAQFLTALADDSDFRPSGEGWVVAFQELLVARQNARALDRLQEVFRAIEPQVLCTPSQVRARALRNQSAPFFAVARLAESQQEEKHRQDLEAKLERRVTLSFSQAKSRDALLSIAKQFQLPIVDPGHQHAEVDTEAEITFTATDEPLRDVLARFLPAGNTKTWLVAKNGTLQTWYADFLPGGGDQSRWLFDVSDLVQPAGNLLPGQLHRTLHETLPTTARFGQQQQRLHLGRYLEVETKSQADRFQQTLHELRTGARQPLPPNHGTRGDQLENLEDDVLLRPAEVVE